MMKSFVLIGAISRNSISRKMRRIIFFLLLFPGLAFSQWVQQNSGTNSFLSKVRMIDAFTGYSIGDSSHVLKTTNGGANWTNLFTGTSPDDYFTGIHFINASTGYVCGGFMNGSGTSKILKTTDGGANWTIQFQSPTEFYFAICFVNQNTGFNGGYDGKFYKTTDGGASWNGMTVTGVTIWTIAFVNQTTGFLAGDLGMLRRTTDCGQTWSLMPSATNLRISSLCFTDAQHGYAVCDSETVIRTTDGGLNWTSQRHGNVIGYESVCFVNQNTGFAVGNWWEVATYKLIRTTNAGVNWHTLAQGQGDPYFDIFFANESTGWIAGYNGLILKTTNGGTTFIRNETGVADGYKLEQNYPNPFNASTKISFTVPKYRFVILKVYDMLGNEVSTLVNENKPAGNYTVDFIAPGLSSGFYYCKYEAGSLSKTMKMVLLK